MNEHLPKANANLLEDVFPEADSVDRLVSEFLDAHRRGDQPTVKEFVDRSASVVDTRADVRPDVRGVLSAALAMEKLKRRIAASNEPNREPGVNHLAQPLAADGASSTDAENACGRRLGDFQLLREIGRGGMGIVYEAEQLSLARRVAVKVLRNAAFPDDARVKRFEREALAAARLHHTNIIPVFGVGEQDGLHYYVMPLIDGVGLDRVTAAVRGQVGDWMTVLDGSATKDRSGIEQGSNVSHSSIEAAARRAASALLGRPENEDRPAKLDRKYWRQVARIGKDAADALHYAHQQGLLHRDIKPANLIVDARGMVWLADFGLAKTAQDDTLTGEGDVVGTLRYMAPENLQGQSSARGDVCSLGLTLYELAVLRAAFDDADRRRLLDQIARHEPPSPRKINPDLPRDMETILLKAIAREPSQRYASAQDLSDDLRRFLEDRPIKARRISLAERFWRWRRVNPVAAWSSTIAVTAAALLVIGLSIAFAQVRGALSRETVESQNADSQRRLAEDNARQAKKQKEQAEKNLAQAESERSRAEANLAVSLEVFEEVFDKIAPSRAAPTLTASRSDGEEAPEPQLHLLVSREDAALLQSLLRFYDRFTENNGPDPTVQRQAASAHRRVGDIQQRLGEFAAAERAYNRALGIYEQLDVLSSPRDEERVVAMASIHNELGLLYKLDGRNNEARQSHRTALSLLSEYLASHPEDDSSSRREVQRELVRTYNFRGFAIWGGGPRGPEADQIAQVTDAEDSHRQALDLLQKLLADDPRNPEYRLTLARSYRDLAPPLLFRQLKDEAVAAMQTSLDTLQELCREYPSVPLYRYELIRTLSFPMPQIWGAEAPAKSQARFEEALRYAEQLATDFPGSAEYATLPPYIHFFLSRSMTERGDYAAAEANLRTATALQQQNLHHFPDVPDFRIHAAMTQGALANLLLEHRGSAAEARDLYIDSIALIGVVSSWPEWNRFHARGQLEWQHRRLAAAHRVLGETELAAAADERANELEKQRPKWGRPPFDRPRRATPPSSTTPEPSVAKPAV